MVYIHPGCIACTYVRRLTPRAAAAGARGLYKCIMHLCLYIYIVLRFVARARTHARNRIV